MEFDVYCDESRPDLFTSQDAQGRYLVIGSLWLPREDRDEFKAAIHSLRDAHKQGPEFKWRKITPSKLGFYEALADWFIDQGDRLRFRCIMVDRKDVDFTLQKPADTNANAELKFYKFYYELLHHWILDFNGYAIFCDLKQNRLRDRLHTLQKCLDDANLSSEIHRVQATRSRESVLMQLTDVFTGAASARMNKILDKDGAKGQFVSRLENKLGVERIEPTDRAEEKFNVFHVQRDGGW